jgi:hypothetical protein
MSNLLPRNREYGHKMPIMAAKWPLMRQYFLAPFSRTSLNPGFASGNIADHNGSSGISNPERKKDGCLRISQPLDLCRWRQHGVAGG